MSGPQPGAPGLFRFGLEGRRAPALFVTGWLASLIGAGALFVGLLGGGLTGGLLVVGGLAILSLGLALLAGAQTVERQASGAAYGGPSPVIVFAAALTTTLVAETLAAIVFGLLGFAPWRPLGDLVVVAVQAAAFIGVVAAFVVGPGAISWTEMGLTLSVRRALGALGRGALYAPPVVVLTALLAAVIVPAFGVSPPSPLPPTGTATGLALHLLAGAVIAPVAEEVLFRGVAVTAWARTAGPRAAIVWSALLFAAAHVLPLSGETFSQGAALAVVAALGRMPVALALGWLYLRSGTLWASIGLHAAFNAALIILAESAGQFAG
ncbi:MAG TPA: type II CAAX endopeptidase family protein [Candidatus Eisenbacteria bacterium]|nr:type II CAAX endopeptidase family protein [Candidatus Eisenbacteria bacterium]